MSRHGVGRSRARQSAAGGVWCAAGGGRHTSESNRRDAATHLPTRRWPGRAQQVAPPLLPQPLLLLLPSLLRLLLRLHPLLLSPTLPYLFLLTSTLSFLLFLLVSSSSSAPPTVSSPLSFIHQVSSAPSSSPTLSCTASSSTNCFSSYYSLFASSLYLFPKLHLLPHLPWSPAALFSPPTLSCTFSFVTV